MNFKNTIIGLVLLTSSFAAAAKQVITIHWPFNVGDPVVVNLRALIDKANQSQNDYFFIVSAVPGAGGNIAAKRTLASPNTSLLATTSTFFVRPMLYPDTAYEFDDFKPSLVMSSAPFALIAKSDFNSSLSGNLKMGIAGVGSTTHLIAEKIKQQHPNLLIVPYKGLSDSMNDLMGGQIDLSLNLIRSAEQYPTIKILGTTGSNRVKQYKLLNELGVSGVEYAVINVSILRSSAMTAATATQIDEILNQANVNNQELDKLYKLDNTFAYPIKTQAQKNEWYQEQIRELKKLTNGIKVSE